MRLVWKRRLLILGAAILIVAGVIVWLDRRFSPRTGATFESWETANQKFKVRADAHHEEHTFLPGAYYVFRSAPVGSDAWHDIMIFRHDDPNPIPRDQVRFVNDRVGFVFMGWMFAGTTDAGATWFVWDADNDLPKWQCCNYRLIKAVHLEPDGTGTMTLNPIQDRSGEVPELRTKDYGRHWAV